ncbi:MAG: radical SAM protein, partial [Actinobacteria bacterium]|nr:radical SAM protein [Actinomycetota bacterium]
FTSPHPKDFTDDVIEAMAATPNVMPSLHMPLQSGSDSVLAAMRRSYRSERFLGIIDRVRTAIPDAAITTDIIVGFPGETEEDFQGTLDVVAKARFAGAFTFQYSKRPGTPAAEMDGQVPQDVVTDRYNRLVKLANAIAWDENKQLIGQVVEVLVANGEGRKDAQTQRLSGRAKDNRLVHFTPSSVLPRPGDLVRTVVTSAAPYHLVADGEPISVEATRSGDAWARSQGAEQPAGVSLGMPSIGKPDEQVVVAPVCSTH